LPRHIGRHHQGQEYGEKNDSQDHGQFAPHPEPMGPRGSASTDAPGATARHKAKIKKSTRSMAAL